MKLGWLQKRERKQASELSRVTKAATDMMNDVIAQQADQPFDAPFPGMRLDRPAERHDVFASSVALESRGVTLTAALIRTMWDEIVTRRKESTKADDVRELLEIFQSTLGASREQCDESGMRTWDRIDAILNETTA